MDELLKIKFEIYMKETKKKIKDAAQWCADNKEISVPIIVGTAAIITKLGKAGVTMAMQNHNDKARLNRVYDPSNGYYLDLKRALRTYEKIELDARRRDGESVTQILADMRLLK